MRFETKSGRRLFDAIFVASAGVVALASGTHDGHAFRKRTSASFDATAEILQTETYQVDSDCPRTSAGGSERAGTLRMAWATRSDEKPSSGSWSAEPLESNAMDLGFPSRTFVRVGDVILNSTRLEDAPSPVECKGLVGTGAAGTGEYGFFLKEGEGFVFLCVDARTKEARCSGELTLVSRSIEGGAAAPETVSRSPGDSARPGDTP